MTSVELRLAACVFSFYFRVRRGIAELDEFPRLLSVCLSRRESAWQCGYLLGRGVGWWGGGCIHAIALPGPTPQQDHAHAGEVGGGQFYGRCDGWWLQRRPSQRPGSAAEIPVHTTGVPRTVDGRDRVLGGSYCKTDPYTKGDQAAAVVHRLRRVSITCMRPSFLPHGTHSILWKSSWTTERTHRGVNINISTFCGYYDLLHVYFRQ